MKNKKIIARIGAVLACVLLVGTLAIPCFADVNVDDIPDPVISDAYLNFVKGGMAFFPSNMSANNILTEYTASNGGLRDFFESPYFMTGYIYVSSGALPPGYPFAGDDGADLTINDRLDFSFYGISGATGVAMPVSKTWIDTYFRYMMYFDSDHISVGLRPDVESGDDSIYYSGSANGLQLEYCVIDGVRYEGEDFLDVDVAVLFKPDCDMAMVGALSRLFFGNDDSINYLASPYHFLDGFDSGADIVYDNNTDEGYENGYKEGYNDAVKEIDDGDFGRNFLGNMFNAPLNALNDFVLVEFSLGDAAPVRLTLGSIVYIIIGLTFTIWLLRAFRG